MRRKRAAYSIIIIFIINSVSYAGDAKQTADELVSSTRSKYADKESLRTNLMNPIISNDTLLSTFDNSKSFNAQLVCPSSEKFLEVFVQPSASGDLSTVIASADTDMDGNPDYSYHVPFAVSGICANGFISCSPGTWVNCTPYRWVANNAGIVDIDIAGLTDLGGCYCINNSCGSSLVWNNLPAVLKDLGGGIATVLSEKNRKHAISDVRIDNTSIIYYGQDSANCSSVSSSYGSASPEQYYGNYTAVQGAVETQVISQSADPGTYYSMIKNSPMSQQSNSTIKSCNIGNFVTTTSIGVNDIVAPVGGSGGNIRPCGEKCIEIVLGIEGDNYWCAGCGIYETYYDILVRRPELINKATLIRAKWDDWMQIWVNSQLVWNGPYGNWTSPTDYPPGNCELSTSWDQNPNVDFTNYFRYQGILRTKNRVAVAGCGEGFSIVRLNVNTACDASVTISNGCSTVESDPACKLKDEIVDGVYTYRNFNPTGLAPIKSCRQFNCEADSTEVCLDWWEKKRVYSCQTAGYDFTDVQKRMQRITSTAQDNTVSFYYQDLRKDGSGNWIAENTTTALPVRDAYKDCEKVCKTKKDCEDTQAGTAGTTAGYRSSTGSFNYFYKTCVNDICPVEAGETIIKDCQCINEFAEAAAIMQTIRMAGQELICSSGTGKPLQ